MANVAELKEAADVGGKAATLREAARPGPITTFPGGPELPEGAQDVMRPIVNFAESYNKQLVTLLGAPGEVINQALRQIGVEKLGGRTLKPAGSSTQEIIDVFESLGVDATPIEGLSADLGRNAFDATLTLAALFAAAPTLVARVTAEAPKLAQRVGAEIGKFFLKRPGLAVVTEAGATAGATIGEREIPPIKVGGIVGDIPVGPAIGALAGGVLTGAAGPTIRIGAKSIRTIIVGGTGATAGGAVAGLPGAIGGGLLAVASERAATRAVTRMVSGVLRGGGGRPPSEPILPETVPGTARAVIEESLDTQLRQTEQEIGQIFSRLPALSAEQASTEFRAGLTQALERARLLETSQYTDDFLAQTADAAPLVDAAIAMRAEVKSASPASPSGELARITAEFTKRVKGVKGKKGRRVPKQVTGLELQQFRSDLLDAARTARSGLAPNRRLARNLGILADAADDALSPIDPQAVETARAVSRRLNDLFFKGPVGRVMREARQGEPVVPEELTVQTLLSRPGGFRQLPQIATEFGMAELEPLLRQAIRAEFRAAAERSGADADRFLARNKSAIESFGDEIIELQGVVDDLVTLEARRTGLQKGVLARFAERDPQVAFQRLFSARDPSDEARAIITTLERNPADLAAFRNEFLGELFRRNGFSAQRVQKMLGEPRISRLVETVLPDEELRGRLLRITNIAAKVETGEMSAAGVRQPVLGSLLGFATRFSAAGLARLAGAKTIQQTGAAATFGKTIGLRMTGRMAPEDVFARAVTDSDFLRLVLQKVPQTAKETADFRRAVRRFVTTKTALQRTLDAELDEKEPLR